MSTSRGPLALTPGLQLKARLMVKDKQLQDMWNPGETLLRVCFEQADDGIFVVASNFSDTQTFKEELRCQIKHDTHLYQHNNLDYFQHWRNTKCEHRLSFNLLGSSQKFGLEIKRILSSLNSRNCSTATPDSSDSEVFESTESSPMSEESPPERPAKPPSLSTNESKGSRSTAAHQESLHRDPPHPNNDMNDITSHRTSGGIVSITSYPQPPPLPTRTISSAPVLTPPRRHSGSSSKCSLGSSTGGGINPPLESSSSDAEDVSPQLPPRDLQFRKARRDTHVTKTKTDKPVIEMCPLVVPKLTVDVGSRQGSTTQSSSMNSTRSTNLLLLQQRQQSNRNVASAATKIRVPHTTTSRLPGDYGDYRDEYPEHLSPSIKQRPLSYKHHASKSDLAATLKDNGKSDEDIALPTRRRRQASKLCCFKSNSPQCKPIVVKGDKLLCEACDQWFFENENFKGACKTDRRTRSDHVVEVVTCTRALNCCLKRCTSDSDGRYNRAWQDEQQCIPQSAESRCRRRALFVLLCCLLPCILCYKPCKACQSRGKRDHCWGARHIPVIKSANKPKRSL